MDWWYDLPQIYQIKKVFFISLMRVVVRRICVYWVAFSHQSLFTSFFYVCGAQIQNSMIRWRQVKDPDHLLSGFFAMMRWCRVKDPGHLICVLSFTTCKRLIGWTVKMRVKKKKIWDPVAFYVFVGSSPAGWWRVLSEKVQLALWNQNQ